MRLLELKLLAFGAFENETLDLSAPGPVLHVVYGPNEAGKSTALRAITGLLYGIPERTGDAFLHGNRGLRIGGRIEHAGETLDVVRRKGRKKTLLDPAGEPIDEAPLLRALGGVSEEIFLTMFGLDHRTLRHGAEALLRGEGGLGESLFDAGGAQGIGEVLAELHAGAEALYKPRGQNQPLAEAFRAYTEAGSTITQRDVEPKAWMAQQEAVEATRAQLAALTEERRRVDEERRRLDRARRVLPSLAEHQDLSAKLDALGDAPRLPDDASARRQRATKLRDESARDAARVAEELGTLERQRDGIEVDEAVGGLDAATVQAMRDMLARHVTATADRPKIASKRRDYEERALDKLRSLGRPVSLDEVQELRIDKATEARIGDLAEEWAGRREALEGAKRRHRDAEALLARALASRDELPNPRDPAVLERALDRARRAGDLDARIGAARARAQAAEEALTEAAEALPRFAGTLAQALVLTLPTKTEARQAARADKLRADRRAALDEQLRRAAEQRDRARQQLDALTGQGDLPTEADLERARALRDRLGKDLRRAIDEGKGAAELDAFLEGVVGADALVDRLRREADRVARWGQLEAELTAAERERDRLEGEVTKLAEEADRASGVWQQAWPGVDAGEPEVMLEWLDEHARLRELAAARRQATEALEGVQREREAIAAGLSEALQALGERAEGETLGPLVDRAQALVERLGAQKAARAALDERIVEHERQLPALADEHEEKAAAMARWQEQWGAAMRRLGLAADARIDEAKAVLGVLREGFEHLSLAAGAARRLDGMDRDAAQFAEAVEPLVEKLAPDLREQAVARAAAALIDRHDAAQQARSKRDELDETIVVKTEELATIRRRGQEAEDELAQLARAAGVDSADDLERAEERASERRVIEERLRACEQNLFGEGLSLDELRAQVAGIDLTEARERLEVIDHERDALIDQTRELDRELATQQSGLERMREREGAHGAADERQAVVAEIRRLAERWATLRLAAVVLEQEIERYREQNEGPVIRRASAIFPKLTLGEYLALRSSYDERDHAELRCLGADGADVPVEGLSDGARDQLYLALRIASLERYAEQAELMPFIADDILVHSDEDRARAALSVLADFAATTQVLMFTHQARHVELAREAIGPERLVVHELEGGRRRAKAG